MRPFRKKVRGNSAGRKSKALILPVLIIAVISTGVYFNALFNGFAWDDEHTVVQNFMIRDTRYLPSFFTHNVWGFESETTPALSNYYRPIMNVIFMMNYHLFGLQAWGFHLVNILIHTAISILVFLVSVELFKADNDTGHGSSNGLRSIFTSTPFMAAVLFATHPVHTEAVTWVTALTEISYCLFYISALYLYIRSADSASLFKPGYLLSLLSFFLATLCKEPALTLPVILVAYDYVMKRPIFNFDSLKRYIPFIAVAFFYMAMRINAIGSFTPVKAHKDLNTYEVVINIFPLFTEYIRKLLVPTNLNLLHVLHPIKSLFSENGLFSVGVVLTFTVLLLYFFKRNRIAFFSLVLLLVSIAPALYIRGIMEVSIYVSERYLYLPSFGFVILIAMFLKWLHLKAIRKTAVFAAASILLVSVYSFGTIERNAVWKDDYTLFSDAVEKSPDDEIAHINLAGKLSEMGMIDEAIKHFQIANKIRPDNVSTYVWLGDALFRNGQKDEAIIMYTFALELDPNLVSARKGLGYAYYDIGMLGKAVEQYQAALSLSPNDADVLYRLNSLKATQRQR